MFNDDLAYSFLSGLDSGVHLFFALIPLIAHVQPLSWPELERNRLHNAFTIEQQYAPVQKKTFRLPEGQVMAGMQTMLKEQELQEL